MRRIHRFYDLKVHTNWDDIDNYILEFVLNQLPLICPLLPILLLTAVGRILSLVFLGEFFQFFFGLISVRESKLTFLTSKSYPSLLFDNFQQSDLCLGVRILLLSNCSSSPLQFLASIISFIPFFYVFPWASPIHSFQISNGNFYFLFHNFVCKTLSPFNFPTTLNSIFPIVI